MYSEDLIEKFGGNNKNSTELYGYQIIVSTFSTFGNVILNIFLKLTQFSKAAISPGTSFC